MNLFRRVLNGRYGVDQLTLGLLVIGFLLALLSRMVWPVPLSLLYYLCLGLCIFRTFSKNHYRRAQENARVLSLLQGFKPAAQLQWRRLREWRTHRYLRCPECKQRLRVPKGKGKISISCSRCRTSFIKKV